MGGFLIEPKYRQSELGNYIFKYLLKNGGIKVQEKKNIEKANYLYNYLDNSNIRKLCGDIALSVIKDGAYYAYIVPCADQLVLQQLPVGFCRTRYNVKDLAAVEFNMKFFDTF